MRKNVATAGWISYSPNLGGNDWRSCEQVAQLAAISKAAGLSRLQIQERCLGIRPLKILLLAFCTSMALDGSRSWPPPALTMGSTIMSDKNGKFCCSLCSSNLLQIICQTVLMMGRFLPLRKLTVNSRLECPSPTNFLLLKSIQNTLGAFCKKRWVAISCKNSRSYANTFLSSTSQFNTPA